MRYRGTDYSVPTAYGHREVLIRGYVHEVVISCGTEVARHPRSYEHEDFVIQGPKDHGVAGLINLFGIESPGLTSSLAIADYVSNLADA